MPNWLAIAIPLVVAVAAIFMWALDYSKKAHEIQKLRLEVEKLRREAGRSEREDQTKASGLYKPTAAEVDRIVRHSGANAGLIDDDGASAAPSISFLVGAALTAISVVAFLLYAVVHLIVDIVRLFRWMF